MGRGAGSGGANGKKMVLIVWTLSANLTPPGEEELAAAVLMARR